MLLLVGVVYHYPGATVDQTDTRTLSVYSTNSDCVYDGNVDTRSYGSCFGFLRRSFLGGDYGRSEGRGSRSASMDSCSARTNNYAASRGCSYQLYYPGATAGDHPDTSVQLLSYPSFLNTVYYSEIDSIQCGWTTGMPRKSWSGGNWNNSNKCGTRSMHCPYFPIAPSMSCSARGCSITILSWGDYI